jgi:hypothetical protein
MVAAVVAGGEKGAGVALVSRTGTAFQPHLYAKNLSQARSPTNVDFQLFRHRLTVSVFRSSEYRKLLRHNPPWQNTTL